MVKVLLRKKIIILFLLLIFSLQAVKQFLDLVNNSGNYPNRKPIPPTEVLKYLRARKFDVQRAVQLYEQNELIRMREGLDLTGPLTDELRAELETGKFTILVRFFVVGSFKSPL